MFRGYPRVGLEQFVDFDLEKERNAADGAVKGADLPEIKRVMVSMSTALRVAKIARDATSTQAVCGTLCGLQVGQTMVVSFAHPYRKSDKKDEKDRQRDRAPYSEDEDPIHLAKCVKELYANEDMDTNMVGQFVAGGLCSKAMLEMKQTLENLVKCQLSGALAVLLCYDPLAASELGKVNFTAYTFTAEFCSIIEEVTTKNPKDGEYLSHMKFPELVQQSKLQETGIFRPVPVEIQCSQLHKMMLHQIEIAPLPTSRDVAMSDFADRYLEELLFKMTMTCDQFKNSVAGRPKKDEEPKIVQILHLDQLKRQTTQLIGLCDSIILHTAITNKIGGKDE